MIKHWHIWSLLFILLCPSVYADEVLADKIIVEKAKRTLTLYHQQKILKSYHITLGEHPRGPKRQAGDNRTPEGLYTISGRIEHSAFHLALKISYPNEKDIEKAKKEGVNPGNRIMIHGLPDDFGKRRRRSDWTHGCIAVTNQNIEEIWRLVPDGTPIEIRP